MTFQDIYVENLIKANRKNRREERIRDIKAARFDEVFAAFKFVAGDTFDRNLIDRVESELQEAGK